MHTNTPSRKGLIRHSYMSAGFTLIELLVVIAIIGILSAVVLAALNTARSKGNDAAIKSDLDAVRTQSAIYYNDNGNYGTNATDESSCAATDNLFADPTVVTATGKVSENNNGGTLECNVAANGAAFAIDAALVSAGTNYWCVDSTGFAGTTTAALGADTVCP